MGEAGFPCQSGPASTVVCRAQRGRWRPQADDTGLTLALVFWFCPAGLTGRALLLFLTSPPRMFLDGGVRSGTLWSSALCASGQASRATRAQRGCTVPARAVSVVCGRCARAVRVPFAELQVSGWALLRNERCLQRGPITSPIQG